MHSLIVQFSKSRISAGHLPFNSWFPYLSLGSPFLAHYQSTPGVLTGLLAQLIGAQRAFEWSLYLLLALWPLSVYIGGRLLGWNQWESAAASAVAPLINNVVGYGFGHQAYVWIGDGLWTQLWGMWLLPITWGLTWRAISRGQYRFGAIVSMALIVTFHFLTAYLAGLTVIVWILLRPSQFVMRLRRTLFIAVGVGLIT
ncbi:MAG TPA: hypothetical protein VGM98_19925, partial [Schlesneria sp.]